MTGDIRRWARGFEPRELGHALAQYEARFEIEFDRSELFVGEELRRLHEKGKELTREQARILSRSDKSIAAGIDILSEVAAIANPSIKDRQRYLEVFLDVFEKLGLGVWGTSGVPPGEAVITPEREGYFLARELGWIDSTNCFHPCAKRVPIADGLLVGLGGEICSGGCNVATLVDGAIASGATIMAIMSDLPAAIHKLQVLSVHATFEGIAAIKSRGDELGIDTQVEIGHATSGLNSHYYATRPGDSDRLLLGDVGDTISPILK